MTFLSAVDVELEICTKHGVWGIWVHQSNLLAHSLLEATNWALWSRSRDHGSNVQLASVGVTTQPSLPMGHSLVGWRGCYVTCFGQWTRLIDKGWCTTVLTCLRTFPTGTLLHACCSWCHRHFSMTLTVCWPPLAPWTSKVINWLSTCNKAQVSLRHIITLYETACRNPR